MSKRVLALVTRGGGGRLTDRTPVTIWEHEIPILEVLHGEGSLEVMEVADIAKDGGNVTVLAGTYQVITKDEREGLHPGLTGKTFEEKPLEEVIGHNLNLGKEFDADPREEYERLSIKYGMHMEVPVSNCQFVYGRFDEGRFSAACGVKDYSSLSIAELRRLCDRNELKYGPREPKATLVSMLEQHEGEVAH